MYGDNNVTNEHWRKHDVDRIVRGTVIVRNFLRPLLKKHPDSAPYEADAHSSSKLSLADRNRYCE